MDALKGVIEVAAIAAIVVLFMAFWDKAQAQKAQAQAQLVKQSGYTNLELMAGSNLLNSIFNRQTQ